MSHLGLRDWRMALVSVPVPAERIIVGFRAGFGGVVRLTAEPALTDRSSGEPPLNALMEEVRAAMPGLSVLDQSWYEAAKAEASARLAERLVELPNPDDVVSALQEFRDLYPDGLA